MNARLGMILMLSQIYLGLGMWKLPNFLLSNFSAFFGPALKPLGRDVGGIQKVGGTCIQGQPFKHERAL